jgi:hypothetical protein
MTRYPTFNVTHNRGQNYSSVRMAKTDKATHSVNTTVELKHLFYLRILIVGMWRYVVGWVVTDVSKERSLHLKGVRGPRGLGGPRCLNPLTREDEDITFLRNVRNHMPSNAASHPKDRNPQLHSCERLKTRALLYSLVCVSVNNGSWLEKTFRHLWGLIRQCTNIWTTKDVSLQGPAS